MKKRLKEQEIKMKKTWQREKSDKKKTTNHRMINQ